MQLLPKVSVIVPVYKAESTIEKCVDSLLCQTLSEFELILVNDGSPDRCGEICNEYARKDLRVKVIHQENSGVSVARQTGLDNATGEYTIHADPDDWVEPTELELLYNKAKDDEADMVICDFYENDDIYHRQEPTSLENRIVLRELFQHLHGSCCNKLVRRSCYIQNNIKFPKDVHYCEDLYVVCSLVLCGIKVSYLPKAFYHYVQYSDTLVHRYDENTYHHDIELIRHFEYLLCNETECREHMHRSLGVNMMTRAFYYGGDYYDSKLYKERFYSMRTLLSENVPWKDRVFVYCSCIGFYRLAFFLYRTLKLINEKRKAFIRTILRR